MTIIQQHAGGTDTLADERGNSHPLSARLLGSIDDVRYIKLGAGGAWEATALDGGTLEWGATTDPVEEAMAGDWMALRERYTAAGSDGGTATSNVREARDFYTGGSDTLWITFARGHLWWAFAEPGVVHRDGDATNDRATRYRRVIGGWSNQDVHGRSLTMTDLSTSLTKTAAYKRTICNVDAKAYLLRTLSGQDEPAVAEARAALADLELAVLPLIRGLHQNDFELFTDLLFSAMGWRRVSALGGTMKDIDLMVELPATGERAAIQVKSAAGQGVVDACVAAFRTRLPGDRFFIVTHTAQGRLSVPQAGEDGRPVQLLEGPGLATAAVRHGLTDWLLQRAA